MRAGNAFFLFTALITACGEDDVVRRSLGDGGAGIPSATCTSGTSCSGPDDCPGVSCACPGIRFQTTIRKCSGNCCVSTCAEACPSGSGAGGSGSGGAPGTGGMAECAPGASDIEADWMTPYALGVGIKGTITLPGGVPPGSPTQLSLEKAGPDPGGTQLIGSYATEANKLTITYHVKLVQDGNYYLSFDVDQSGNGAFGDPGDLHGFYDGTTAAPIMTKADAPVIAVRSVCQSDRDFGVGPLP